MMLPYRHVKLHISTLRLRPQDDRNTIDICPPTRVIEKVQRKDRGLLALHFESPCTRAHSESIDLDTPHILGQRLCFRVEIRPQLLQQFFVERCLPPARLKLTE